MYGIFGKPLKRAFRTCMGHGGVGPLKKKIFEAERGRVMDFWPFSRNFHRCWGVHMGWCHVNPPNSPHYPHMPPGMGPHGPRTFTHDPPAVGWLSVGSRLGVGWGPDCDPIRGGWLRSGDHVSTPKRGPKPKNPGRPRPEMDSAPLK